MMYPDGIHTCSQNLILPGGTLLSCLYGEGYYTQTCHCIGDDCQKAKGSTRLQALEVHANAAGEPDAHEAMLVSLQCMHALMSGACGMHSVLSTRGFLPAVCATLAQPGENEAAKLVVEMLIKLCLFSTESYCLAVKVCLPSCLLPLKPSVQSLQ